MPQLAHARGGDCGDQRRPPMMQNGDMPPYFEMQRMDSRSLPPPLDDLDLSDAQQKKIGELMQTQSGELRGKQMPVRQTMQALHQLAASGNFNPAQARKLADEHGKALAEMVYLHTEIMAKIYPLLTEVQRKQMDEPRERRNDKMERRPTR